MDMVEAANSGHPGLPMGAAVMAHQLWTGPLSVDPSQPEWFDRDLFILSAGHVYPLGGARFGIALRLAPPGRI